MNSPRHTVVIVDAIRTPIGKARNNGMFASVHPNHLLAQVYQSLFDRTGVDAGQVGQVLAGCVQQLGPQASNIARNAWLQAGLPTHVPATSLDFQCGSSQQALHLAASTIAAGTHDCVVAAGVESMSVVPFSAGLRAQEEFGDAFTPEMQHLYELPARANLSGQGAAAERIADKWNLSRPQLDDMAVQSHARAEDARRKGEFSREILPIEVKGVAHNDDEGIRPGTSAEKLAGLAPAFGGKLTAATSSQVSDGAAAVLLMSEQRAAELGLQPRAIVRDHVVVGDDPHMMLTGPIPATTSILKRNSLSVADIGAFEINEAFASVVGAWMADLEPDPERVNIRGGAMALGHPLGASGVRLITTLLHIMEDTGARYGLSTMCCGGGLGTGTLVELR
ncbi:thiolase family protein [Gordonia oryzae]|uniref:Thiolase family protein n=1 Tax=Gordonia oryzae TaxID=2487349 RepID=A0A3N4H1F0_9ACTN|nr:thiolase family protein [Gordonia oryzae]RPA59034.1 thiolase family protein [Gordonia oryzae]